MQASNPQSYLIKNAKNLSFFFYLDKHKILNYKTFSTENELIEEQQVYQQTILDFSVVIDTKDQIHLICITKDGNLLYFINAQNKWENKPLARLDYKSNSYKHLTLIQRKDYTHIFCNKSNLLNPMVTSIEHIYWNDKLFNKGTIISYLPGKYHAPFQVDIDSINNVHLIYKVLHRNNHQLSYCKFNVFNKKWSTGEIITNLQEDNSHPFMLIDKKDNLHLAWCTITDNNFTLKYRRKSSIINQKSKWSQVAQLSNKNANYLSPVLQQEGNTIKLLSKQNGTINEITSEDYGMNWSSLNKGKGHDLLNSSLLKYSSNAANEKNYYTIPFIYGSVDDGINVIATRLYNQTLKNPIDIHSEVVVKPIATPRLEPSTNDIMNDTVVEFKANITEVDISKTQVLSDGRNESIPSQEEINIEVLNTEEKDFDTIESSYEAKTADTANEATEEIEHILIDSSLKNMIQEVQSYVNKMVLEIEKQESTKKALESNIPIDMLEAPRELINNELNNQLKELNSNLLKLEDEQLKLECELGEFHKKIYNIEERLITYKKQFM